jgi:hypothetical protein
MIRTQTITDRRDTLAQQIAELRQQYDATEAVLQQTKRTNRYDREQIYQDSSPADSNAN